MAKGGAIRGETIHVHGRVPPARAENRGTSSRGLGRRLGDPNGAQARGLGRQLSAPSASSSALSVPVDARGLGRRLASPGHASVEPLAPRPPSDPLPELSRAVTERAPPALDDAPPSDRRVDETEPRADTPTRRRSRSRGRPPRRAPASEALSPLQAELEVDAIDWGFLHGDAERQRRERLDALFQTLAEGMPYNEWVLRHGGEVESLGGTIPRRLTREESQARRTRRELRDTGRGLGRAVDESARATGRAMDDIDEAYHRWVGRDRARGGTSFVGAIHGIVEHVHGMIVGIRELGALIDEAGHGANRALRDPENQRALQRLLSGDEEAYNALLDVLAEVITWENAERLGEALWSVFDSIADHFVRGYRAMVDDNDQFEAGRHFARATLELVDLIGMVVGIAQGIARVARSPAFRRLMTRLRGGAVDLLRDQRGSLTIGPAPPRAPLAPAAPPPTPAAPAPRGSRMRLSGGRRRGGIAFFNNRLWPSAARALAAAGIVGRGAQDIRRLIRGWTRLDRWRPGQMRNGRWIPRRPAGRRLTPAQVSHFVNQALDFRAANPWLSRDPETLRSLMILLADAGSGGYRASTAAAAELSRIGRFAEGLGATRVSLPATRAGARSVDIVLHYAGHTRRIEVTSIIFPLGGGRSGASQLWQAISRKAFSRRARPLRAGRRALPGRRGRRRGIRSRGRPGRASRRVLAEQPSQTTVRMEALPNEPPPTLVAPEWVAPRGNIAIHVARPGNVNVQQLAQRVIRQHASELLRAEGIEAIEIYVGSARRPLVFPRSAWEGMARPPTRAMPHTPRALRPARAGQPARSPLHPRGIRPRGGRQGGRRDRPRR